MLYAQNINDCLASEIGDGGLEQAAFERYLNKVSVFLPSIRAGVANGEIPFLNLPKRNSDLPEIRETAARFRGDYDDIIVLGTGGSSLGGRTLCALAPLAYPNLREGPRIRFADNVDPHSFDLLIADTDWTRTGVIAISKSGATAETLAQFAILWRVLLEHMHENQASDRVAVITEPGGSPLASMAAKLGCRKLNCDQNVGGRYSAFSVTGLLPAAIAGLDIDAIRAGAATVLLDMPEGGTKGYAPAEGAAVSVGLDLTKNVTATILMPYCDRLADFALWYRQLWAESIGKAGRGTTPIRAIGTVDQHSQIQLYLDGPANKMYTLMLTDTRDSGPNISMGATGIKNLGYLNGRTIGDLLFAAGKATAETLANNGRPTRLIHIPKVDEESIGALMMHYMLETIIAADLYGVDPYNQPAVEEGKVLTREFLGEDS